MSMKLSLLTLFLGVSIPGLLACLAVVFIQDRYGFAALAGKSPIVQTQQKV